MITSRELKSQIPSPQVVWDSTLGMGYLIYRSTPWDPEPRLYASGDGTPFRTWETAQVALTSTPDHPDDLSPISWENVL